MSSKNKTHTPKQASIRIGSLLKGIDNSVAAIKKHQSVVQTNAAEVKTLVNGLSNAAQKAAVPAKPAAKPAAKTEQKKAAKPAQKPAKAAAKPAQKPAAKPAAKAAKPAKAAAKPAAKPAAKAKPAQKPPVAGRPSVREIAKEMIAAAGGTLDAGPIWNNGTQKYGYFSRQSLYSVLKDEKSFKKTNSGFKVLETNGGGEDDADKFVAKIEKNQTVGAVS